MFGFHFFSSLQTLKYDEDFSTSFKCLKKLEYIVDIKFQFKFSTLNPHN